MSTITFERVAKTTDRVRAEARSLDPARVLFTLLMIVPFVLGWLIGQIFKLAWAIASFAWTAGVVGFRIARGEDST